MSDVDEGVARLESVLGGTRVNAERALRELHALMARDLRRAERRADRAERRAKELQDKLRRARRRAKRAEADLARRAAVVPDGPVRATARLLRRVKGRVVRASSSRHRS